MLVAAISTFGLIVVALIGMWGVRLAEAARIESAKTNKELQGNGSGTMLQMVTEIHKEIGAAQEWRRNHEALHETGVGASASQAP